MSEVSDPSQLVRKLLQGKPVERVPFFPLAYSFCARNVGYAPAVMYDDPQKSFAAQLWTFEQYGFDWGPAYGFTTYGTWETQGVVEMPDCGYEAAPPHRMFPVKSEEDLDSLRIPEVRSAGRVPLAMEFSRIQSARGMPIAIFLGGSFTLAGNICPVELLCRWILKSPDRVHRILRLATDQLMQIVQLWADTFGAENFFPQIGEPLAGSRILSPQQFASFVLPYLKEVSEKILNLGVRHLFFHICGDQNLYLPFWAQIPMGDPGICSLGSEVDLDTAIKSLGNQAVIAGNIDPRAILDGPPQRIYDLCRQALEKGKKAPRGFMLMPGCEILPETPPYHVYVMKKALSKQR